MPHVITQSCCGDGSCVYACPVNCIHPDPEWSPAPAEWWALPLSPLDPYK